jgi:glycosyltransferase involved in cell wall biosynthesis
MPTNDGTARKVSVIIPVWNGADTLPYLLRALVDQRWPAGSEVLVADNGSTDGTAERAREFADRLPALQIVSADEIRGSGFARNRGISVARGDYLLFLDADDIVAPDYVENMAAALDQHEFVAARLDCESLNPPWATSARRPHQTTRLSTEWGSLPFGTGGSLGVRREVAFRAGGFDANLVKGQDVDFCWRVQELGFPLHFVLQAAVQYRYRLTFGDIFRQARGFGEAGPKLYRKHRHNGMRRRPGGEVIRFWWAPLRQVTRIRGRAELARFVFLIGFRLGMLEGCLRARVVFL